MNHRTLSSCCGFRNKLAPFSFVAVWFFAAATAWAERPTYVPKGFSLQWQADFANKKTLEQLAFTDPKAWRLSKAKGKPALELSGA